VITYAIIAADPAPAQPPAGGEQGTPPSNPYTLFIIMGLIFAVFYFLLIRPQRKKEQGRQRQREEMLSSLRKSDHVVTIGGIHGIVAAVSTDEVVIKVDEKNDVRLRVARDAISKVVGREGEEGGERKLGEKPEENR